MDLSVTTQAIGGDRVMLVVNPQRQVHRVLSLSGVLETLSG